MKEKVCKVLRSAEMKGASIASVAAVAMSHLASAADAETKTAITTAFTTGFTTMADDALSMIAVIVPIAIGVAGVIFLTKKAMGWFKSLAK